MQPGGRKSRRKGSKGCGGCKGGKAEKQKDPTRRLSFQDMEWWDASASRIWRCLLAAAVCATVRRHRVDQECFRSEHRIEPVAMLPHTPHTVETVVALRTRNAQVLKRLNWNRGVHIYRKTALRRDFFQYEEELQYLWIVISMELWNWKAFDQSDGILIRQLGIRQPITALPATQLPDHLSIYDKS